MKRAWDVSQMVAVWVRVRVSEDDLAGVAACDEDARELADAAASKRLRALIDEMGAQLAINGGAVTDRDLMPNFGPDVEVEQVAGDPLPPLMGVE